VANPWLERRVLAFAHQGGAKEAPSSTLYAIERAVALGANVVELDVHRSHDGTLVVCHDPTLERTTDGAGTIATADHAELMELDAAYWFVPGAGASPGRPPGAYPFRGRAPRDRRFGLATLDEALEATRGVFVNLDIKEGPPEVPAYESDLALALRRHRRERDVIVASFSDHRTEAFSAHAPGVATSPGVSLLTSFVQAVRSGTPPPEAVSTHAALQVPDTVGGVSLVDERLVEATHRVGLALHVFTVDDEAEMARLVDVGVDGVMSDLPSTLVGLLKRRGVAYRS